ncbi:Toll/interleukin-1 receptor domain-containing protein [Tanacetum coccineum]
MMFVRWGSKRYIGGGGKTTLARAVFNQISMYFEAKSFIENVREVSKSSLSGIKKLQKQILSYVLNEQITLSSVYDGKNMMKRRMCGRKVLLVLDNVCLWERDSNSRVHRAFKNGNALERLKIIPLKETLDKLELSYISLEEDYKKIFLDVACFLKGWPKDAAIRVIESYGLHARNGLGNMKELRFLNVGSGRNDPPFGFLKHGHVSQYLSLSHYYGKFDEVSQ